MQEKAELRVLLAGRRAVAQALLPHAGARLAALFPAQVPINAQTIIAAYMPFRTEIDPLPLLRVLLARGARAALPRISPSPLWGGVGVGELKGTTSIDSNAPALTAPTPTPPHKGEGLCFHLCDFDNPQHFQPNAWGIREPRVDLPIVAPTILLVPLLGFDRRGYRLGYGKGFYDRAITDLKKDGPLTTIGLAFSAQEVPIIPTQHHDQCLDWIITENGAYPRPS